MFFFVCLFSVSVIEPGPVQTQFVGNMEANKTGSMKPEAEVTLGEGVDDLTQQLYKATFSGIMESFEMVCLISV